MKKRIVLLIALISQALLGCSLTAKYKQNPDGIAKTTELKKIEDHRFILKQDVYFTRNAVQPSPETALKDSSHRKAYDLCGSFREIKKIQFDPIIIGPLIEKTIYKNQVSLQSMIDCLDMSEHLDYGMRKTFLDNKNLVVIMTALEVEFDEGFDINQFLEDEFKFHAEVFCEKNDGIDSTDFFINEGYVEYSLPKRYGLYMFYLDGNISCK